MLSCMIVIFRRSDGKMLHFFSLVRLQLCAFILCIPIRFPDGKTAELGSGELDSTKKFVGSGIRPLVVWKWVI